MSRRGSTTPEADHSDRAAVVNSHDTYGGRCPVGPVRDNRQSRAPSGWGLLRPLLRGRWGAVAALVAGSVLSGLAESGILAILAEVGAALVNGTARVAIDFGPVHTSASLGTLLAVAGTLALLRLTLQAVVSVVPAHIAADVQANLRVELFGAFTRASWGIQSRDREGHLQELLTNQIARASVCVLFTAILLVSIATLSVLILAALMLNVLAAVIVLVAAIGMFTLMRPLSRLGSRRAHATSSAGVDYASGINEAVRVAEEAQVFGASAAQRARTHALVVSVRVPYFHTEVLSLLVTGVYQSLMFLLIVGALAGLYATGATHIASLGAVVLLLVRAGTYGQQAQGAYQQIRQTLPYLDRVEEARRRYTTARSIAGARRLMAVETFDFEHVSFEYEAGRPVVRDITVEVSARETVGLVGPSGSGKSTLVQILLGLRLPTSGRYLVNGAAATQFSRDDWHEKMAYVPQEPRLLHATVAENIRFYRDIDDDAVQHAARLAGIHEDITHWPSAYDTPIGPRADAISGGQQQRICLARALAAQPEVLILDEPTSALDPHSERLIQESLATLRHKLTLFIVAHRMSTLDICDRIMVIVDGRLEAFDVAERLRSENDYYRSSLTIAGGSQATAGIN